MKLILSLSTILLIVLSSCQTNSEEIETKPVEQIRLEQNIRDFRKTYRTLKNNIQKDSLKDEFGKFIFSYAADSLSKMVNGFELKIKKVDIYSYSEYHKLEVRFRDYSGINYYQQVLAKDKSELETSALYQKVKSLDQEKKAKVFAKIQELNGDFDPSRIGGAYISPDQEPTFLIQLDSVRNI